MVHLELRNLRHFAALMNHRSFVLAAQAVNLSQPAFSRSIQALEHQAGCKLVDREQKGLPPTRQGQLVLSYALDILGRAQELSERIGHFNDAERERLRFGCGPVPAAWLVPRAVARFIGSQPNATTRFVVNGNAELDKLLVEEEIEFFISNSLPFELDPNYRVRPLRARPWCFYCRSGHPLASATSVTREQIFAYPLACTFGVRKLVLQYSGRKDYLPTVECENGHALLDIVLNSDAIGCSSQLPVIQVPAEPGQAVHPLRLADIPLDLESLQIRDGVVSLRRHSLSPLAQSFIDLLDEMDHETSLVRLEAARISI
ncbi:LysR family transcriptional regulator [Pseudomonas aeruginosa]